MNPKAIAEAFALMNTALELFTLARETLARLQDAASAPITDADLAALQDKRSAALDRLAKSIG